MRSPLLIAALATLLLAAPAASASTVSLEGGVLLVVAAPGELNQVSIYERIPPGQSAIADYSIKDSSGGATPGPGCALESRYPSSSVSVCPATGVQRVLVRLGDGDDVFERGTSTNVPIEVYGESGRDRIALYKLPGHVADGGDGDDQLDGGDVLRGGPGNDRLRGYRLLEGGDGDDDLLKNDGGSSEEIPGRIDAGAGNDTLWSADGQPDVLICGEGRDVITSMGDDDQRDASCELPKIAKPTVRPRVTIFELPGLIARPGKDGRLRVWMRCSVPACAVTVRILWLGDGGTKGYVGFRPRDAPIQRLVLGTTTRLVRIPLSAVQRRVLRRAAFTDGIRTKLTVSAQGGRRLTFFTDGLYCTREDPCDRGAQ